MCVWRKSTMQVTQSPDNVQTWRKWPTWSVCPLWLRPSWRLLDISWTVLCPWMLLGTGANRMALISWYRGLCCAIALLSINPHRLFTHGTLLAWPDPTHQQLEPGHQCWLGSPVAAVSVFRVNITCMFQAEGSLNSGLIGVHESLFTLVLCSLVSPLIFLSLFVCMFQNEVSILQSRSYFYTHCRLNCC